MKCIIIKDNHYTEYPFSDNMAIDNIKLSKIDSGSGFLEYNDKVLPISEGESIVLDENFSLIIFSDTPFQYRFDKDSILVGRENCDINIGVNINSIICKDKIINEEHFCFYINGIQNNDSLIEVKTGDNILFDNILLILHSDTISIYASKESYNTKLEYMGDETFLFEGFPDYRRSPRVIKKVKTDKIDLLKPPTNATRKKGSLLKVILPPLSMAAVSALSAIMMGRGIFVIIALLTTMVTLVISVTTFFSENKELKEKNKQRKEVYENYLLDMRKHLDYYKNSEIEALNYNYPNVEEIETMVNEYNPRIYERDIDDDDFLTICIGKTNDDAEFKVSLDYDTLSLEKDELLEETKEIFDDYQTIENKPIIVNLKNTHLGIVGEVKDVHQQIKNVMLQTTFFQSYHDIEIIMLYNQKYEEEFDYIKRYPHVKLHSVNLTGNVNSERVRDQILGSLYQILKDRKLKRDENKREMRYLPHYLIIVDDYHLVTNHSIMEYLQESTTDLGFTLIYSAQKRANLPENIKTVLLAEDIQTSTLLLTEGIEVNRRVIASNLKDINLDKMARNLSLLNHLKGVSTHIPESITYFGLYGVNTPNELNIAARWEKAQSHKSLSTPLGVRAEDDIVELNLHEKAHGPHGLVAGTTGSGKSEIIQSYILSLATNFSPYEVGFLLIDYKGGGMANLFKNLPHLLGTITNLDGTESMRALASIKAELSRRQRILSEYEVNNINKYTKLFKSGNAKEPLPHLFIISDEFAELKKEQPDFMTELVSVARIGRTLGVHLILATQKPTGVVDDQIWSNSKFKLALKVQDESDSKEIIKTADASFITLPGRAYLQVGNNEIYELFQSAWSGAEYKSEEEQRTVDTRIYKINLLGQCELINQDLSDVDAGKDTSISQLDAVVNHISEIYTAMEHLEVTKPWLPSLKTKIISPYIQVPKSFSDMQNIDLNINVGLMDIPEYQKQENYSIDFNNDGNLAIFASSGYGSTVTLSTIITSLAVKNNPSLLNFYILDFGNSGLISLKQLPHVADYMTFDSTEKLSKFTTIMEKVIKERKQVLGEATAQNFDVYNKMCSENKLSAIFIIIDKYDIVKEVSSDFEDFMAKLTRDGASLGVYTVISATKTNAVRFATMNNFKNKIVQYMFDEGDISSIIGRSTYILNEIKGRALIKGKIVSIMQVYLPINFEDDVEYMVNFKTLISDMADNYSGPKPLGIPILPEIFTTRDFMNYAPESKDSEIVGLSINDVELVSANLGNFPFMIVGPSKSGKTNLLEVLLNQDHGDKYLFDSDSMELFKYRSDSKVNYIENKEEALRLLNKILKETLIRKDSLAKALVDNPKLSRSEFFSSFSTLNIYIDNIDYFIKIVESNDSVVSIIKDALSVGINVIYATSPSGLREYDDLTKFFKDTRDGVVLGDLGMLNTFDLGIRDTPTFGYGVLFKNGAGRKVKLPKFIEV